MRVPRQGYALLSIAVLIFVMAATQRGQLLAQGDATPAAEAVAAGKAVFEDKCATCHSADTDEMLVGPGLKGLFKWPPHKMSDGTEHTEHTVEIIRQQITDGGGSMPPIDVSGADLDNLIAYLQTL